MVEVFKKYIACLLFLFLLSSLAGAQEVKIGDDLSRYAFAEDAEAHVLKAPIALYKEASHGADRIELPAGTTVLLGGDSEGMIAHEAKDGQLWYYVMDENKKMIGWATDEEIGKVFSYDA